MCYIAYRERMRERDRYNDKYKYKNIYIHAQNAALIILAV